MIVRTPLVLIGLALVAIPIAIHLLVRAPAAIVDLPSLRFVRPSTMRALRRHLLDDAGLLGLRMAILAAAVVALADPLVLAGCRREAWNTRLVRAVVIDTTVGSIEAAGGDPVRPADATIRIETTDLRDGVRRAQAWLADAPPGRREIVVASPFTLGSIDDRTIAGIPASIGLRFAPRPASPTAPKADGPGWSGLIGGAAVRIPTTLMLEGPVTHLEAGRADSLALAVDEGPGAIAVPAFGLRVEAGAAGARPDGVSPLTAARAALDAVIAAGVAAETTAAAAQRAQAHPITLRVGAAARAETGPASPWMAAVIRAVASDPEILAIAASARATAMGDGVATTLVRDETGAPLVTVTAGAARPAALVVSAHVPADSVLVPTLLRALVAIRAAPIDLRAIEPLRIPAEHLTEWAREPAPLGDDDVPAAWSDRRWAWGLALLALVAEAVWRRRRRGNTQAPPRDEGAHAA